MSLPPPDEHLGDRASALLDGELDGPEADRWRAHAQICPLCQMNLRRTSEARLSVRSLGMVEVPAGVFDRLLAAEAPVRLGHRRRRRWTFGAVNVAGAAAAWVFVLSGATLSRTGTVAPSIGAALSDHERAEASVAMPSLDEANALSDEFRLPSRAVSFELAEVSIDGQSMRATYTDGFDVVSVFREPGELSWDDLPDGVERVRVGDRTGALVDDGELSVLVVERSPWVYAVVAPTDSGVIAEIAEAMPSKGTSVGDRIKDATRSLVDCFGLRG